MGRPKYGSEEFFSELVSTLSLEINRDLVLQVFRRSSYLHENPNSNLVDNEKLEWLGDAVISLAVSEFLYREKASLEEGPLTDERQKLVNRAYLAETGKRLGLIRLIPLSKAEAGTLETTKHFPDGILENVLEALVGAIFLDQGYEKANAFIKRCLISASKEENDLLRSEDT